MEDFKSIYCGTFQISDEDQLAHAIGKEYHERTENYDKLVCTGGMGRDGVMPANDYEYCLINKNAIAIRRELKLKIGDGPLVDRAIRNYHNR